MSEYQQRTAFKFNKKYQNNFLVCSAKGKKYAVKQKSTTINTY